MDAREIQELIAKVVSEYIPTRPSIVTLSVLQEAGIHICDLGDGECILSRRPHSRQEDGLIICHTNPPQVIWEALVSDGKYYFLHRGTLYPTLNTLHQEETGRGPLATLLFCRMGLLPITFPMPTEIAGKAVPTGTGPDDGDMLG